MWPPERIGHVSIVMKERFMFIIGGYNQRGLQMYVAPTEMWVYDMLFEKWEQVIYKEGDCPPGISASTVWTWKNNIFLFGGFTQDIGPTNDFYMFSFDDKMWTKFSPPTSKMPSSKDKACGWVYKDMLYLFGGYGPTPSGNERHYGSYTEDEEVPPYGKAWNSHLHVLDPKSPTDGWSVKKIHNSADAPLPRAAAASAILDDGRVYIFGGRNQANRMDDLHMLDLNTDTWSGSLECGDSASSKPCGRSWHTLSVVGANTLLLYGGYSNDSTPLDDCWILHVGPYHSAAAPGRVRWQAVRPTHYLTSSTKCRLLVDADGGAQPSAAQLPQARFWHTAAVNSRDGDMTVLIYGGCFNNITQQHQECSDQLITIHTKPRTLYRLCIELTLRHHKRLQPGWSGLPSHINDLLSNQLTELLTMSRTTFRGKHICAVS